MSAKSLFVIPCSPRASFRSIHRLYVDSLSFKRLMPSGLLGRPLAGRLSARHIGRRFYETPTENQLHSALGKYFLPRMRITKIQYCEKVMRAKCANFVLCPCELSTKFRSKIQASFRDVSSVISLKQREKIRRIFEPSAKIR